MVTAGVGEENCSWEDEGDPGTPELPVETSLVVTPVVVGMESLAVDAPMVIAPLVASAVALVDVVNSGHTKPLLKVKACRVTQHTMNGGGDGDAPAAARSHFRLKKKANPNAPVHHPGSRGRSCHSQGPCHRRKASTCCSRTQSSSWCTGTVYHRSRPGCRRRLRPTAWMLALQKPSRTANQGQSKLAREGGRGRAHATRQGPCLPHVGASKLSSSTNGGHAKPFPLGGTCTHRSRRTRSSSGPNPVTWQSILASVVGAAVVVSTTSNFSKLKLNRVVGSSSLPRSLSV